MKRILLFHVLSIEKKMEAIRSIVVPLAGDVDLKSACLKKAWQVISRPSCGGRGFKVPLRGGGGNQLPRRPSCRGGVDLNIVK